MKKASKRKSQLYHEQVQQLKSDLLLVQQANILLYFKRYLCGYMTWSDLRAAILRTLVIAKRLTCTIEEGDGGDRDGNIS